MPRVTQEYRDQRRQQILTAARRCFIREGFHKTSMTDILSEGDLSAGSLYGHFKSKHEMIMRADEEKLGMEALLSALEALRQALAHGDGDAIKALLRDHVDGYRAAASEPVVGAVPPSAKVAPGPLH